MSKLAKIKKIMIILLLIILNTITVYSTQFNTPVRFIGVPTVSDKAKINATITDEANATINAEGLTKKGEYVIATYKVENISTDLIANIEMEISNSNKEFFSIQTQIEKNKLEAGETTTVKVKVELIKTPISEKQITTIKMKLNFELMQPGQKDETSENPKDQENKGEENKEQENKNDSNTQIPSINVDTDKDNKLDGVLPNTGRSLPALILIVIFIGAIMNIIYNIVKEKKQEDE